MRKLASWLKPRAPFLGRDVAGVVGAVMIVVGLFKIYEPAGWIGGGLMLVAAAFLVARAQAATADAEAAAE